MNPRIRRRMEVVKKRENPLLDSFSFRIGPKNMEEIFKGIIKSISRIMVP